MVGAFFAFLRLLIYNLFKDPIGTIKTIGIVIGIVIVLNILGNLFKASAQYVKPKELPKNTPLPEVEKVFETKEKTSKSENIFFYFLVSIVVIFVICIYFTFR